jgi:hypothetical protein
MHEPVQRVQRTTTAGAYLDSRLCDMRVRRSAAYSRILANTRTEFILSVIDAATK